MHTVFLYIFLIGLCGSIVSMTLMSASSWVLLTVPFLFYKKTPFIITHNKTLILSAVLWMGWNAFVAFYKLPFSQATSELAWAVKLLLPLAGLYFLGSAKTKIFEKIFWIVFSIANIASFYVCFDQVYMLNHVRAVGFHRNPVYLALNHGLLVVFLLCIKPKQKFWNLGIYWLNIILLLGSVLMSGTRATLIVLPVFLFVAVWKMLKEFVVDYKARAKIFGGVFLALVGVLLSSSPFNRLLELKNGIQNETSANARIEIWKTNIGMFLESPVMGTGYRANALWAETNGQHLTSLLGKEFGSFFAHNQYLQSLAESGVVGFVLLVLYLYGLFKVYRQSWAVFGFLILIGLFDAPFTVSRFLYPFGFCFLMIDILNKKQKELGGTI